MNLFPINILPINVSATDIGAIITKTLEKILELKSHVNGEYKCVDNIFKFIIAQDIPVRLKYTQSFDDPLITEALVNLNGVLTKTYIYIKQFKEQIHIKCIDYPRINKAIEVHLNILQLRLNLFEHNKLKI